MQIRKVYRCKRCGWEGTKVEFVLGEGSWHQCGEGKRGDIEAVGYDTWDDDDADIDIKQDVEVKHAHPDQPKEIDKEGVERFKANAIVRYLLDAGPFDMNHLAVIPFSDEDRIQFAQLIGYSICGWSELSYVSDEAWERVNGDKE